MEDSNVCCDGTVRNIANRIVKFIFVDNEKNAIFLEDLIRCFVRRTIRLKNEKMRGGFDPRSPSQNFFLSVKEDNVCALKFVIW